MAYRLESGRPAGAELKRIARKQLTRASAELTAAGARLHSGGVHETRKHVKKVRALLRLAAPWVSKRTFRKTNRRLQTVSHRLGPIADPAAAGRALTVLARRHRNTIPKRTFSTLRRALQERDAAIRRAARQKQISAKCVHVLLTRDQAAVVLRSIARERRRLRHRAETLAAKIYAESPG